MPNRRIKLSFPSQGSTLAGLLETPERAPRGFALFAHCFTCGKDSAAATRIARELTGHGFAVLRFDFTGLGGSDGDFANANFSSNIADLVAAADYLRDHYRAPTLLVGHSLGGRAVLSAAQRIPETRAVVTLGAPADTALLVKQFAADIERIRETGAAQVSLGGRRFTIKKQFLDDIEQDQDDIERLRVPLLVMHAPFDRVVPIDQAEQIYRRAKHPKSFISLDTADHLLSDAHDAAYVASVIGAWSSRYLGEAPLIREEENAVTPGEVEILERNHRFTRQVSTDHHQWFADEPQDVGGDDLGPDPYEHLLAALGACTSMTLRMYANRKQLPLEDVLVTLNHSRRYIDDCEGCDQNERRLDVLTRRIELRGDLDSEQRQRLIEIADKCPVHRTLEGKLEIDTRLKE